MDFNDKDLEELIDLVIDKITDLIKERNKLKKELEEAEKEISFLHEELNKNEFQ